MADGKIDATFLDAKGMFTGILIAILSVEITKFLHKKRFIIKMPNGVPDMVTKNFEIIIPLLVNAFVFVALRLLVFSLTGKLIPEVVLSAMSPFVASLDTVWGVMFLVFMIQLLWWFGIHGDAALSPIFLPIALQYITENANAYAKGEPLPHVFTESVLGNFFLMSGSGLTMGLVLAMLISKSKRFRSLGKIAFVPGIFGINEPVTFGTPIVYNPILFIPYVIGPTIMSFFIYMAFSTGVVPMAFTQSPGYTPWLLQGFIINLSWKSAVFQLAILIVSTLMYYPFFKILEKQEIKLEDKQKSKQEVDKELEELELDF
jgi:cellobiose PTS system EIIC component